MDYSGPRNFHFIGNSFIYIEISSNIHGSNVFCGFERTDIIQNSNITLHYTDFPILTIDSLKATGRFRVQLLIEQNVWSVRYRIPKNDQYSNSLTQSTKLGLNFTVENYGFELIYDEIESAHSDMSFSSITKMHSVY